jgi:DNA polymerase-3 subunit beta
MIFSVSRKDICEAVGYLSRAVASKAVNPIMEGILISAESGFITLAAYNFEIGMKKKLPCICEKEGDIVLSAKLLGDIIRKMPEENIRFEVNENNICEISSGSSHFQIIGMKAEEFPELPSAAVSEKITLPGNLLKSMVRQTIFAVDFENQNPIFTGVYFEIENDYIKLVAIDGLRLAIRKETIKMNTPMKFILTGKAIGEVIRIINSDEENVTINVGKNHATFEIEGYYVISRLIDGEYIDYNSVIAKSSTSKVKIRINEVTDIIERISLIIENQLQTPVRCKIKEDEISLPAQLP